MTSTTVDVGVRTYVQSLERLLDDLPDDDRHELLEDLEQHLTEVAAEGDGSLHERLGAPETYAAELRASAGLPPRDDRVRVRLAERLRRSPIGRALDVPAVRAVREFLPDLRPGWWVLRGYLAVLAIDTFFFRPNGDGGVPMPSFGGSGFLGLVGVLAGIWASVLVGRLSQRDDRVRRAGWLVNPAVVLAGLLAISQMSVVYGMTMQSGPSYVEPFLHHADGTPISNVCAYDSKLEPLRDVLLYDQFGRPIVDTAPPEWGGETIPGSELERGFLNVFPRKQMIVDPNTGELRKFKCPALEDSKSSEGAGAKVKVPKAGSDD